MKIDAIILSYKRERNLNAVIRGIKRQSLVQDIYLFHNAPSKKKIPGVINICSEMNYGCIIRHAMGLLINSDYVLFVDDDLELNADFSLRFSQAIKRSPQSIVGVYGANINPFERSKSIYSSGGNYQYHDFPVYVDIVKGRVLLCKKEYLLNSLEYILTDKHRITNIRSLEDDIIVNLSTQLKTKIPSLLIPVRPNEIIELPDPHGLESSKNHYNERDKMVSEFVKKGWKPLAFTEKYILINSHPHTFEYLKPILYFLFMRADSLAFKRLLDHVMRVTRVNDEIIKWIYRTANNYRTEKKFFESTIIYHYLVDSPKVPENIKGASYLHLGNFSLNDGKEHAAIKNYKLWLKFITNYEEAPENLKMILHFLVKKVKFPAFKHLLDQTMVVISRNMDVISFLYQTAYDFRMENKLSEASIIYQYLVQNPKVPKNLKGASYFHLGNYLSGKGLNLQALKHFKYCLKYIPDHEEASKAISKIKEE